MKKYVPIFFAIVISVPMLFTLGTLVYYELNRSYFSQELCEQKDIKDNTCHGTCALSKKLKTIKNSEKSTSEKTLEIVGIDNLVFKSSYQLILLKPIVLIEKTSFSYTNTKVFQGHLKNVFHPPKYYI